MTATAMTTSEIVENFMNATVMTATAMFTAVMTATTMFTAVMASLDYYFITKAACRA